MLSTLVCFFRGVSAACTWTEEWASGLRDSKFHITGMLSFCGSHEWLVMYLILDRSICEHTHFPLLNSCFSPLYSNHNLVGQMCMPQVVFLYLYLIMFTKLVLHTSTVPPSPLSPQTWNTFFLGCVLHSTCCSNRRSKVKVVKRAPQNPGDPMKWTRTCVLWAVLVPS